LNDTGEHILIVGAGQAGLQAAETLRSSGFAGKITLHGDEPYPPYHRPPLSKAWLTGETDERQLTIRDASVLDRKNICLEIGSTVERIDTDLRVAHLGDGSRVTWSGLILATGARPRRLRGMKASKAIHVLRSMRDAIAIADGLRECVSSQRPVIVVGGGFIGLEIAASARKLGLKVFIIEAAERLLDRVLCPTLSNWYANLHRSHGAEVVVGAQVSAIDPLGADQACVRLADGRSMDAGLVVVGIGVHPNDDLAREAGIKCDNGIIVDGCGRTSSPNVVAAGDCTVRRLDDGSSVRLESVQNAVEQARSAAQALLGIDHPFSETPWFWSDQYDAKLQIAGLARGADTSVVRGNLTEKSFSIFHFKAGRLIAVDSINAAKIHILSRKFIGAGFSPTIAQVQDPSFDLASLKDQLP